MMRLQQAILYQSITCVALIWKLYIEDHASSAKDDRAGLARALAVASTWHRDLSLKARHAFFRFDWSEVEHDYAFQRSGKMIDLDALVAGLALE